MTENMKVWNAVKQPPPSALRQIMGGRLKGKTDISPQWRYQVMTEQFGQCGIGWSYEIVKVWNEPLQDGQVFAFAEILLHVGDNASIPGIGGSMLVEKEKEGLHTNDEGYKMAITDALSVAMKMLGVAADIYAGMWDGTKYKNLTQETKQNPPMSEETSPHFCEIHGVNFFKKGKMKGYAHPIANTNGWCNESETIPEPPQQATDGPDGEIDTVPPTVAYLRSRIKDHMKALGWKKKEWDEFLVQSKLPATNLTEEQLTKIEKTLSGFVEVS